MSEAELSNEFTLLHNELEKYTIDQFRAYNSKYTTKKNLNGSYVDKSTMLSECYIHLFKCKDVINNISELTAYSKKFIRSNIYWDNSIVNKARSKKGQADIFDYTFESNNDIYKISEEYINYLFENFSNTLTTYDKGLFNIYLIENKQTGKEIAAYLNISESSAYQVLKECKEIRDRFKQYIIT